MSRSAPRYTGAIGLANPSCTGQCSNRLSPPRSSKPRDSPVPAVSVEAVSPVRRSLTAEPGQPRETSASAVLAPSVLAPDSSRNSSRRFSTAPSSNSGAGRSSRRSAPSGHSPRQAPSPSHRTSETTRTFPLTISSAPSAQAGTHSPHPVHNSSSILMIGRPAIAIPPSVVTAEQWPASHSTHHDRPYNSHSHLFRSLHYRYSIYHGSQPLTDCHCSQHGGILKKTWRYASGGADMALTGRQKMLLHLAVQHYDNNVNAAYLDPLSLEQQLQSVMTTMGMS